jgi:hypothetical protein
MPTDDKKKPPVRVPFAFTPITQDHYESVEVGPDWQPEKAEIEIFKGFRTSADVAREQKEAKQEFQLKYHVPRATRHDVEKEIRRLVHVRLDVIKKSPELQGIPLEELPIRDERWQKAARRLHKAGVVNVPDRLFHTPEDRKRIDAKKDELLRIHNQGSADSEG